MSRLVAQRFSGVTHSYTPPDQAPCWYGWEDDRGELHRCMENQTHSEHVCCCDTTKPVTEGEADPQ